MRRAEQSLEDLIEPVVRTMGYELVGIQHVSQGHRSLLRIYIDSERGITLADCERVSHQVSGVLDVEEPIPGRYTLEVSSPGLDRPLFRPEHYRRFAGSRVRLKLRSPLEGRRKLAGLIERVEGDTVLIREQEPEARIVAVPLENVERANLVPEGLA